MTQLNWNQVPSDQKGFVAYSAIRSMLIRQMVARAEKIKLEEELKARLQWHETENNDNRMRLLVDRLNMLDEKIIERL